MSERATCALCGLEGHDADVRVSLVQWTEPVGEPWEAVDRCRDRVACRRRVEAADEVWPIVDLTRDLEDWANRDAARVAMPEPVPVAAAVGVAEPLPEPAEPPTWVAPFIDEPEEEQPWP